MTSWSPVVFILFFNRLHKVNVTELDDGKSGMRNRHLLVVFGLS